MLVKVKRISFRKNKQYIILETLIGFTEFANPKKYDELTHIRGLEDVYFGICENYLIRNFGISNTCAVYKISN